MLDAALIARAINDASSLVWFGLALAPLYGGGRFTLAQIIAGATALGSLAVVASLTMLDLQDPGASLVSSEAANILGATSFGQIWLLRAALCAAGLACLSWPRLSAVFAGAQLAALAFTGHAFARGGAWGAGIEAAHLLAAGAWVGGALALALARQTLRENAERFSRLGYVAASIAPIAGLAVLALTSGAFLPDLATAYGRLAAAKLALFFVLLALAAANRFYSVPRANITALRAGIAAELVAMTALSLTAATLAATSPAM